MGADKRSPPQPDAFSKALVAFKPASGRHAAILQSWRDHSDKDERDELWRSLGHAAAKRGLAAPRPEDLIGVVLGCTVPAAALNDHSQAVLNRFEKMKREIIKVVEDADYPSDLWRDLQRFEARLWDLDRSDYDMHAPAAGGRKDANDSRDRRLFSQRMFRYLKDSCGEPLVKEVTLMLNIIFPGVVTDERLARQWLAEMSPGSVV